MFFLIGFRNRVSVSLNSALAYWTYSAHRASCSVRTARRRARFDNRRRLHRSLGQRPGIVERYETDFGDGRDASAALGSRIGCHTRRPVEVLVTDFFAVAAVLRLSFSATLADLRLARLFAVLSR